MWNKLTLHSVSQSNSGSRVTALETGWVQVVARRSLRPARADCQVLGRRLDTPHAPTHHQCTGVTNSQSAHKVVTSSVERLQVCNLHTDFQVPDDAACQCRTRRPSDQEDLCVTPPDPLVVLLHLQSRWRCCKAASMWPDSLCVGCVLVLCASLVRADNCSLTPNAARANHCDGGGCQCWCTPQEGP